MKSWKVRLLMVLTIVAMLAAFSGPAMAQSNDPTFGVPIAFLDDLNDDDNVDGDAFFLKDPTTGELDFCTIRVNRLGHERLHCDPVFD